MDVMHQKVKDILPIGNLLANRLLEYAEIDNDMDNLPTAFTAERYHSCAGTLLWCPKMLKVGSWLDSETQPIQPNSFDGSQ